jgi:hypothetical protein
LLAADGPQPTMARPKPRPTIDTAHTSFNMRTLHLLRVLGCGPPFGPWARPQLGRRPAFSDQSGALLFVRCRAS